MKNNVELTATNNITLIIDCSGFPYVDYLGLCALKRVLILYIKNFNIKNIFLKFRFTKILLKKMLRLNLQRQKVV